MTIISRSIIADHYFRRYFDLGLGVFSDRTLVSMTPTHQELHSYTFWKNAVTNAGILDATAVALKIYAFVMGAPAFALNVINNTGTEYGLVVDALDYEMWGSRYSIAPSTLAQYEPREIYVAPLTQSEIASCYQSGVAKYIARNKWATLTEAFEALRRGKSIAVSPRLISTEDC